MISNVSAWLKQVGHIYGIEASLQQRYGYAWALLMLWFAGNVVLWTLLIATLQGHLDGATLIRVFSADLALTMLGTGLSFWFLHYNNGENTLKWMIWPCFALIAALNFVHTDVQVFFILLAKSFFWAQGLIHIHRKIEELFRPSEARKLLAKLDTAHVLGTLLGAGMCFLTFEMAFTHFLGAFWVVLAGFMLYLLHFQDDFVLTWPKWFETAKKGYQTRTFLGEGIGFIRKYQFIPLFLLVVVGFGFVFTGVEMLFLEEIAHHTNEALHLAEMNLQASLLDDAKIILAETADHIKHTVKPYLAHENVAHAFSFYHVIWSVFAVILQWTVAPKILSRMGVISLMGVGLLAMSVVFLFGELGVVAVVAFSAVRIWVHTLMGFVLTPQHMAYYSLPDHGREPFRLIVDGILFPLGGLLALGTIFWGGDALFSQISLGILLVLGTAVLAFKHLYTKMSMEVLQQDVHNAERFHHLEVLDETGHSHLGKGLISLFHLDGVSQDVKHKALLVMRGHIGAEEIPVFLQELKNSVFEDNIPYTAQLLKTLAKNPIAPHQWHEKAFTYYNFMNMLKKLQNNAAFEVQKQALRALFEHMSPESKAEYFLSLLKTSNESKQEVILQAFKHNTDPSLNRYLKPHLYSASVRKQGYAVMALWKCGKRTRLRKKISQWLEDNNIETLKTALYTIGEINAPEFSPEAMKHVRHASQQVRLHAIIALGKLQHGAAADLLVKEMQTLPREVAQKWKNMTHRWPQSMQSQLENSFTQEMNGQMWGIFKECRGDLNGLSAEILKDLRDLYHLAEEFEIAERLHRAIIKKN